MHKTCVIMHQSLVHRVGRFGLFKAAIPEAKVRVLSSTEASAMQAIASEKGWKACGSATFSLIFNPSLGDSSPVYQFNHTRRVQTRRTKL